MPPPILVTGSHRSGTTWVGRMLASSADLAYLHEPFNPQRGPGWVGGRLPYWYLYVSPANEHLYRARFDRVVAMRYPLGADLLKMRTPRQAGQSLLEWPRSVAARARRATPLMKDPIALFSAPWLAGRYGARVVVMIRHPAAFAGSLKRLGWRFDFSNWANQPLLLEDLLGPYETQIRDFAGRERDIIDQAVLLWNAIHHVILVFRDRHPGWDFRKYEDLAGDPLGGFKNLFERLGLPWTARAREHVTRFSSERNPGEVHPLLHRKVKRDSRAAARTWVHRLTEEERDRVRSGTADVASSFYEESEWVAEGSG